MRASLDEKKNKESNIRVLTFLANDNSGSSDVDTDIVWTINFKLGRSKMIETHKHHFQVADIGDWDLDQDRSIVPSIHSSLKRQGIEGVVDGDEMNNASFTVWTYSPRVVVEEALKADGIELED